MAQLETSKPFDGLVVDLNLGGVTRSVFLYVMLNSGKRLCRERTKFHFTVDEGKVPLNSSREKKRREEREGGCRGTLGRCGKLRSS